MSRIIPTVGRNILVRQGRELTAGIVTAVLPYEGHGPYWITVSVQPNQTGKLPFGATMPLIEQGDVVVEVPELFAEWMDYQKDKATELRLEKTELCFVERMRGELQELQDRLEKLETFFLDEKFAALPESKQHLLHQQASGMQIYLQALSTRYLMELRHLQR